MIFRPALLFLVLIAGMVQAAGDFAKLVEEDWRIQEWYKVQGDAEIHMNPEMDAAGGCDGRKTGRWEFHTGFAKHPWWQVDLGGARDIDRVLVWNRCDTTASRASHFHLLLSDDGKLWRTVYKHDGTVFYGFTDHKPLEVKLKHARARFVRIQLPGSGYLHLDEVEVFGPENPARNLGLHRPATQVSVSQWSSNNLPAAPKEKIVVDTKSRWVQRRKALANPLLDFDAILFTKRVPGSFNHMSDQYYGWWSRPGGGMFILRDFKTDSPRTECLSRAFKHPGSFLRPALSYDAKEVLFAWCRYYPNLRGERNKLDKSRVPEDAFYHLFKMNIDGSGLRQLSRGKYDDFDARYLPDGRIVFLSTRRGQFIQCGPRAAGLTLAQPSLPDCYVRCGGGPSRPVAVYTLHTMNADGSGLCPISPFEMFEWTPSMAQDGTILYSRWDYIDRHNMPYMSLWSIRPDGTNARAVYGNHTRSPHCTFEPRSIPNSHKIVFTASAHHAQTMGSLVLLDPTLGVDGKPPITRLTPEVKFPEIEGWPKTYYANPWPLSERYYLVSWGAEDRARQGQQRAPNNMGIYLFDSAGTKELLYRDADISCMYPIPVRARPRPPSLPSVTDWSSSDRGAFFLADVYRGLKKTARGTIKRLRIVAVPPKTHPTMNHPQLGLTRDDPGKCVLGTVPVEKDGSAYFHVPAGVIVFFQALDARGMAVQTMRTTTHVQAGQTLGCVGCHEAPSAPAVRAPLLAARRPPSRLIPGPVGSWPLRFDRLIQPALDRLCVRCHSPQGSDPKARAFDLTPNKAYDALVSYGKPSLRDHILARYRQGYSSEGACTASQSQLLKLLTSGPGHQGIKLDSDSFERLVTWMDTCAQRVGSFSQDQEHRLENLRARSAGILASRPK